MVSNIQAKDISLSVLENKFGIQLVEDEQFFREWQDNLPEITDFDKQFLDQVKASYFNLIKYPPMLETTVKMVVLSPLLQLAGFYLFPFHIKSEAEIEISFEDEEDQTIIRGKMDVLVLQEVFWVMAIESKRAEVSIETGLAQILAYMLANPHSDRPLFGMLANGRDFQFIKMTRQGTPQYALSNSFDVRNRGNELYTVLRIMKLIAGIIRE
ncbi:restriction endonuclease subunit R [Argonema antarcticum]|uniref:restriction endonuclease subunit R n=1 Tax=Argonema antarcticum TaxID=2942763 RepID=UPI00201238A7|nr:restriction endonuclease subunit R [Argonema antarcticum]MCL1474091.1 restriction endonuclease subunit R [Argonema antarcticum A004/B2]